MRIDLRKEAHIEIGRRAYDLVGSLESQSAHQ